jgi:hypothetical protein
VILLIVLEKVNYLKEKGLGSDATQVQPTYLIMIPRTFMETMMSKTNTLETRCTKTRYVRQDSEALWQMEESRSATGELIGTTIVGVLCSYSFDRQLLIARLAVYKRHLQLLILLVGVPKHS